jgi:hypothetical protein
MKKGFIAALTAASLSLVGSAFAIAPTIQSLPDIVIGDKEDNVGTDNNFFSFTDAFKFADKVSDPDTPVSELKWSFDEHDALAGGETTGTQWFQVNGKDPIHKSTQEIVDEQPAASAHLDPTANEIAQGNEWAAFRDIVLSPVSETQPFSDKGADVKARHEAGKFVRFYVSDGFSVASKECFVKSVDEAFDSASATTSWKQEKKDGFETDPTAAAGALTGWSNFTFNEANLGTTSYNSSAQGLQAYIYTNATKYRSAGWTSNLSEWLEYGAVGADKYVRVKYYMYATGQSTTAANVIPNMRLRAANRFAVNSILEVLHHDNADVQAQAFATDFRPSTDPTKPSLYRVDYDPVDVPYLVSNATINATAGTGEGISRAFEAYTLNPQDNGYIVMTESVMGTYLASELDDSAALAGGTKIYQTSSSDAGDLKIFNSATDLVLYNMKLGSLNGEYAAYDTTSAKGTYAEGAAGVTMDTKLVPAYPIVGIVQREFNPDGNTDNLAARIRVAPDQQYKVRWHITSTQQSNQNAQIRLRARTVKFQWTQKYELGGSRATTIGSANGQIATQALPGVGCQNPDKIGTENGGWYTMLVNTPMSADIRPDVAGDMSAKMPNLSKAAGPGQTTVDPSAPAGAIQMRDLRLGCEVVDSISWNDSVEKGNFTIDKIEVRTFNLVDDGGYVFP